MLKLRILRILLDIYLDFKSQVILKIFEEYFRYILYFILFSPQSIFTVYVFNILVLETKYGFIALILSICYYMFLHKMYLKDIVILFFSNVNKIENIIIKLAFYV